VALPEINANDPKNAARPMIRTAKVVSLVTRSDQAREILQSLQDEEQISSTSA